MSTIAGMLDRNDREIRTFGTDEARDEEFADYTSGYISGDWVKIRVTYEIEKEPLPTTPGSVIKTSEHGFLVLTGTRWGNAIYDVWPDNQGVIADYVVIFDNKEDK